MSFCVLIATVFFATSAVGNAQQASIEGFSPKDAKTEATVVAKMEAGVDEELAGVTEAVESKGSTPAQEQAQILHHALEKNTALVQTMLAELNAAPAKPD